MPSLEELVVLGQAGNSKRKYSGSTCRLHLKNLDDDFGDSDLALHAPNPWGLYDVASYGEYVWSEGDEGIRIYDEIFEEYIFVYGDTDSLTIKQEAETLERNNLLIGYPVNLQLGLSYLPKLRLIYEKMRFKVCVN